jgi:hypothetical protein
VRARIAVITALVGLLAAALVLPVAASTPGPERTAPDRVRLSIKVRGCDTCTLGLTQLHETGPMWTVRHKRVRNGQVFFNVPATRTHGVLIGIAAPWTTDWDNGARYVVVRYHGFHTGDPVSPSQAAHARGASGCWSGTNREHATLHVRVVRTDGSTIDGQPAIGMRAFTTRTLPTTDAGTDRSRTIVTSYPMCPSR